MCVFSKPLVCRSALEAEMEAIFYALIIVRSRNGLEDYAVGVESDSMEALRIISKEVKCPWPCEDLLERIDIVSRCFKQVSFKYRSRSLNMDADALAKRGLTRISPCVVWH